MSDVSWVVRSGLIFWGLAGFIGWICLAFVALCLIVGSVAIAWDWLWAKVEREWEWRKIRK